ncbi:MAG: hypothetical protein NTZ74_00320 [Chloroflexi bacterium]|nr:hypothetical protein [Chloroflexota bacterium]
MSTCPAPVPSVIAALHLPPFPASSHPDAKTFSGIRDFALRNIHMALSAGIGAIALQDLGEHPVARPIPAHIIAGVAVVGAWIREEFPDLTLGVSLLGHGGREPLAIAQAIGAQFVRIKVYVGAMVKAEGLLEGCAAEAISYRSQIGAGEICIFADVHDRTGHPLGSLPLIEEFRQAAVFGCADGVVLTGSSFSETLEMIEEVRHGKFTTPILIGGGVNPENVAQALKVAGGVIVSSAFKEQSAFTRESMRADWDHKRIAAFMQAVNEAKL